MRDREYEVTTRSGWRAIVNVHGKGHPATLYEPEEFPDTTVTGLWYPDGVEADPGMLEHLPALWQAIDEAALEAHNEWLWSDE